MPIHRGAIQDEDAKSVATTYLWLIPIAHDTVIGDNVIFANNASVVGMYTSTIGLFWLATRVYVSFANGRSCLYRYVLWGEQDVTPYIATIVAASALGN